MYKVRRKLIHAVVKSVMQCRPLRLIRDRYHVVGSVVRVRQLITN